MANVTVVGSGGNSKGKEINLGNVVSVIDGGLVTSYTVGFDGSLCVENGGSAVQTVVNNSGSMEVAAGGYASNTSVFSGGKLSAAGESASLQNGCALAGGSLFFGSGAIVEGYSISAGVQLSVSSGALISGGEIAADFELNGSADGTTLTGKVTVNGGHLNSATVTKEAVLGSGAVAEATELKGTLKVENGGTANLTSVTGKLEVSAGGVANSNIISNGKVLVSSGGLVSATEISGGSMVIEAGGTASATTVNSVNSSAFALVISGSAEGVTVKSGGRAEVKSGGYITGVVLEKDSYFYINAGAQIGTVTVSAGSEINGFVFKQDEGVTFSGSLKISAACVQSGMVGQIYSGQSAIDTVVDFAGDLRVDQGGKMSDVTVSSGGRINGFLLEETQTGISSINLNSAVVSGSKGADSKISAVSAVLHDQETVNHAKVTAGGVLYVNSGASAHIDYWQPCVGSIYVAEGGQVTYASDYQGWFLGGDDKLVSHGTSNTDKHFVGSSASYNSETNTSSVMSTMQMHVMASGQLDQTHVGYKGEVFVYSGGIIRTTLVDNAYMFNGGTYYSSGGGVVYVSNGGSAASTTIASRAMMRIYSGGNVSKIFVNAGEVEVLAGGVATDFYHYGTGQEVVSSIDQGWIKAAETSNLDSGICGASGRVFVRGNARVERAAVYNSGTMTVDDNGSVTHVVVFSNGKLDLAKDAIHQNVTVKELGILSIADGNDKGQNLSVKANGVVNGFIFTADKVYTKQVDKYENAKVGAWYLSACSEWAPVNSAILYGNQRAINTEVKDGTVNVFGTVQSTTVSSGGKVHLLEGAVGSSTVVYSSGRLAVSAGAEAHKTVLQGSKWFNAGMNVYSGGSAREVQIDAYGDLSIASGGRAEEIKLAANGYLWVNDGASLGNTEVEIDGTVNGFTFVVTSSYVTVPKRYESSFVAHSAAVLYDKQTALDTEIRRGGHLTVSGGEVKAAVINGGAMSIISSGGSASGTVIDSSGRLSIKYGGQADLTKVYNGAVTVADHGVISQTCLSSGGALNVSANGSAWNTVVCSGGVLTVEAGGTHYGRIQIESGAKIQFNAGANINLDISGRNAAWDAMINDYSWVEDLGTNYFVTVADGQADGVYKLVGNIPDYFRSTFTIAYKDADGKVITIATNRSPDHEDETQHIAIREKDGKLITYTFSRTDNMVVLTVSGSADAEAPSVEPPIIDDGTVTPDVPDVPEPDVPDVPDVPEPDVPEIVPLPGQEPVEIPVTPGKYFVGRFNAGHDQILKVSDGNFAIYGRNSVQGRNDMFEGWSVAGAGDFNNDGRDDVLLKHESNLIAIEYTKLDNTYSNEIVNMLSDDAEILGVGDFDGNGEADVLLGQPGESVNIMGMWQGGKSFQVLDGYSDEWQLVGIGDFNGDGKSDTLWKKADPELVALPTDDALPATEDGESPDTIDGVYVDAYATLLTGVQGSEKWQLLSTTTLMDWNYLCTGDFNGDGIDDVAMLSKAVETLNEEGEVIASTSVIGIWTVNENGTLGGWEINCSIDTTAWELVGAGDFNGDGIDEIAWSSTGGDLAGCTGYFTSTKNEDGTTALQWNHFAVIA